LIIRLVGSRRNSLEILMLAICDTVRDTGVQSIMIVTSGNRYG
jgi:hypothetical protein